MLGHSQLDLLLDWMQVLWMAGPLQPSTRLKIIKTLLVREKKIEAEVCITMGPGKKKLSIKIERDVKDIVG